MVRRISYQIGGTHNLTSVVQETGEAERAAERANILHAAIFPKERVNSWNPAVGVRDRASVRDPHDLSAFVYRLCQRIGTAQRSQVKHDPVVPQKTTSLG